MRKRDRGHLRGHAAPQGTLGYVGIELSLINQNDRLINFLMKNSTKFQLVAADMCISMKIAADHLSSTEL